MKDNRLYMIMTIALAVISLGIVAEPAHALSGAIFTTDKNGHTVNGNIYKDKCDVYLDGGPGSKAPASSASLPEGWYYFQVTDPSGKVLLSSDGISDRLFYVNQYGVIDAAVHPTNPDKDGKEFGAVVVQLCPYDDTPNSGGVYKVWVTRMEDYDWGGGGRHGFIPSLCKTDNFKVAPRQKPPEQYLIVKKFKDCNANGLREDGEQWLSGWDLLITPPDGPTIDGLEFQTPYSEIAWPGVWTVRELMPNDKWLQTALIIDGIPQEDVTETATVTFGTKSEIHVVVFGNIPTGCITACKFYDSDADGERDAGEPGVEGVKMTLTGRDVLADLEDPPIIGNNVEIVFYTEPDGCVTFEYLFPGTYTISEEVPTNCNWVPTTPTTSDEFELLCTENQEESVEFGNVITGTACFSTKGYWHNKNGLDELDQGDIDYANTLLPYSSSSSYFDAGDEPFDGFFSDYVTLVEAAYNNDKITDGISAGEGTAKAEVSHFLVNPNGDGGPREQLAQQLLAFIFNVRNRLGSETAVILEPDLWEGPASGLIAAAIEAWQSGDATLWVPILDELNNRGCDPGVEYALPLPPEGCVPVTYPEETQ